MEVVVTNEFTHMNAGPERRPFKVLTPRERSTAMVIARYSNRSIATRPPVPDHTEPPDLLLKAICVGGFFAACAFAFLLLSQRHLIQQGGQTLGPLNDSIQRVRFTPSGAAPAVAHSVASVPPTDAKTVSPAVEPQTLPLPEARNLTVTEFNLSVTPEFQSVGDVELRLAGVNTAANTYDIMVKTNQREFYRQDVKLAERVALAKNVADGPELVVGAITQNSVFGYVSEPQHRGHRRRHRRK
jgi:hypothetical protein